MPMIPKNKLGFHIKEELECKNKKVLPDVEFGAFPSSGKKPFPQSRKEIIVPEKACVK